MTIHWKAVEQYFTVVLSVFQFNPACNFGEFINFGLGTVRGENVKNRLVLCSSEQTVNFLTMKALFRTVHLPLMNSKELQAVGLHFNNPPRSVVLCYNNPPKSVGLFNNYSPKAK